MTAAQRAENYGDEEGLTWYLQWRTNSNLDPLTKFGEDLAEALSLKVLWNIS